MKSRKLYALTLLAVSVFQTNSAAQTAKNDGILSPELKRNAEKLLAATAREARQLNAAENRVRAQASVANLLWEQNEREARALFQNAAGELQNLIAAMNLPEGTDEMTQTERAEHYEIRGALADLRRELVLSLAARDAQAALDALDFLKVKPLEEYDPLKPDELELQLMAATARRSPEKSLAIARRQYETGGLIYQFTEAVKDLHRRDSRAAGAVAREVLAKIKQSKILVPLESNPTDEPKNPSEINFWQLSHFINTATELNRAAARDREKKTQPLFSASEMKELVEIVANAFLAAQKPSPLSISQAMPEIVQFAPALAQTIRRKIGAAKAGELDQLVESHVYAVNRNDKSVEQLVKEAERNQPKLRDQRLEDAARRALGEGDAEKAQTIAARIRQPENYNYLFKEIKDALPLSKAKRGDATAVRRLLAEVKTAPEKIETLTELAVALHANGEKETADKLLDEARAMLPANLKNYAEVESAVRVGAAGSIVAPDKAFAIFESGITQSDEYISAAIKMDEFYIVRSSSANELLFSAIEGQLLATVPNATELIGNLARADFERAIGLADKFQKPEIRFFFRLRVLEVLLDANAAEKERTTRKKLAEDGET